MPVIVRSIRSATIAPHLGDRVGSIACRVPYKIRCDYLVKCREIACRDRVVVAAYDCSGIR
jgi:hypothetical protein